MERGLSFIIKLVGKNIRLYTVFMSKERKTMGQALEAFSKKFAAAKAADPENPQDLIQKPESKMSLLQKQINEKEEEEVLLLKKQLEEFFQPRTQDIEKDQEDLTKAYNLYCQLVELNKTASDSETHLKDLSIISPLCKKSEYTANPQRFSLLRHWFLTTNPLALYVPLLESRNPLEQGPQEYLLTFVDKEDYQASPFEKQLAILTELENQS